MHFKLCSTFHHNKKWGKLHGICHTYYMPTYFLTLKIYNNIFSHWYHLGVKMSYFLLLWKQWFDQKSHALCILHFQMYRNKQEIPLSNLHRLEFRMKSHGFLIARLQVIFLSDQHNLSPITQNMTTACSEIQHLQN